MDLQLGAGWFIEVQKTETETEDKLEGPKV
jgi:hypothetical protein